MRTSLNALEARIVAFVSERYPVTVEELRDGLSVRRDLLDRTLKGLVARGVLELEPLPDKTYIRLLVSIQGPKCGRSLATGAEPGDDDSIAYR